MWAGEEKCREIIEESWSFGVRSTDLEGIMNKIARCGVQLSAWNKNVYGNVQKILMEAKHKLEELQAQDLVFVSREEVERARKEDHT